MQYNNREETSLQTQPEDKTMSMARVVISLAYLLCTMISLREAMEMMVTMEFK